MSVDLSGFGTFSKDETLKCYRCGQTFKALVVYERRDGRPSISPEDIIEDCKCNRRSKKSEMIGDKKK